MTRTFSTVKSMLLIGALALVVISARDASAQHKCYVNVPLAFTANHFLMPAGYYEVLSSESSLTLINVNSRKVAVIVLTRKESGGGIETRGCMQFFVSGNRHVLTHVQFAGSSLHSKLLGQPKRERTVARNAPPMLDVARKWASPE